MNNPRNGTVRAAWRAGVLATLGTAVLVAQESIESVEKKKNEVPGSATPAKLAAFEVTGSRIKRTDLEGPSPVHVITREEIDLAGAVGLTDIMREIPEATLLYINEGSTVGIVRGASALDLRSLGPNNTLILVDGRRQAPNGISSGGTVFVDLNRFPTAMIERVEVLKDGASAIYGADATAGVVNIILRKDFSGAELSVRYGNYFKTDGAEQSWSFLGGASRGRARVSVTLTHSSHHANAAVDEPFSANADLTERVRAYDAKKYASSLAPTATQTSAYDFRSTTGPFATVGVPTAAQLTANGLTSTALLNPLTGATSAFLPGTGGVPSGTLGAATSFASVPRSGNLPRPTAAQFVPRAFVAGDSGNSYNVQQFVWNVPASQRRGLALNFAYDLAKFASLYASVSSAKSDSTIQQTATPISTGGDNSLLVPASNYYNPFGIPVAFAYRPLDVEPRLGRIRNLSLGVLAGVKGTWRERFDWDLGISSTANDARDTISNSISERRLRAALAKSTPDAFNIFGGPTFKNDPATLAGIKIAPSIHGHSRTTVLDAHVSSAELFSLPWGRLGGSFALEHRAENFDTSNDPLFAELDDVINAVRLIGAWHSRREIDSLAAELRLPLVREGRFRFLRTLELSAAGRFEKFSDGYDSGVKPFSGMRLRPTRDLLLRASLGKVFRAPSLPQLFAAPTENYFTGLPDLRRPVALTGDPVDSTTFLRTVRSGGNAHLRPEDGRTKQIGAVYDVPWRPLKGLSLDFTHGVIQQADLITTGLGSTFIRQNELTSTRDLVVRETGAGTFTNTTSTPIEILSGAGGLTTPVQPGQSVTVPGRISYLLDSAINLADQIVRYDDYGLCYDVRTEHSGHFTVASNWTYYEYYASRRFTNSAYVSNVGRTLPRYRGQSSVVWRRGQWSANAGMNYVHRRGDLLRDGGEVQRYYTYSAGTSYAFRHHPILGDTRVAVGIENLLGRDPPIAPQAQGYPQTLVGRPGGRFGFVSVRKTY